MAERALDLDDEAVRVEVAQRLGAALDDAVTIERWSLLSGGAIQQNLLLDVVRGKDLHERYVLRTDARSSVPLSRTRAEEYGLLCAAVTAGVRVPVPVCAAEATAHRPAYFVMRHVEGVAAGHRLTRPGAVTDPDALVRELGANLARLHAIDASTDALRFLGPRPRAPTRGLLDSYRSYLDGWRARHGHAWPALEWGLHWWQLREPADERVVLVHRDYRIGNLMVHQGRLTATLDWEFAGFGNPLEDIGWFCAPCWRFAGPDKVAGGLADAAAFLAGYNPVAGTAYTEGDTHDWQALAQLRWAVIALQQCERHQVGGERSLELALTGRLLPGLERDLLALTA
jgi:aminoglycoside phosphotransferase (APT) family kinase protein